METTTTSIFLFVFWACVGGLFVLAGLLMEAMAEKKRFKNINAFRWWATAKRSGERIVILGIVIEIVVAGLSALHAWKNEPNNAPINSISAVLKLKVSGARSEMFKFPGLGVFERPDPDAPSPAPGEITFIEGTNTSKSIYSLSCSSDDIQALGSGLVGGSNDWRGLIIRFHEGNFSEWDMTGSFASNNFVNGTSVGRFNEVGGIVIALPKTVTNLFVHSGIVEVKINSSRWEFPIPPQKPYLGVMTSQITTNAAKKIDAKVLPIWIADWAIPARFPAHLYDGK